MTSEPSVRSTRDIFSVAAEHWAIGHPTDRSRWWMHPAIHRHLNRIVCGEAMDGPHMGFTRLIRAAAPHGGFDRGVSIGCGTGGKEAKLLRAGIVKHFDLFEIGETRRAQIRAKADEHGVGDRITIHIGDAFASTPTESHDLVYWNNALHHMLDADRAITWSRNALRNGGCFAMDDFVGPSRFQWPDEDLEIGTRVRELLPARFLVDPRDPERRLDPCLSRPAVDHMLVTDPSEAADSERILPLVAAAFPAARTIPTGGIIYHLALNDVLSNFAEGDGPLLQTLLLLDETLTTGPHALRGGHRPEGISFPRPPEPQGLDRT